MTAYTAMTLRVPAAIRSYAMREADAESARTGRTVTLADILRDLMREGMTARQSTQHQTQKETPQ